MTTESLGRPSRAQVILTQLWRPADTKSIDAGMRVLSRESVQLRCAQTTPPTWPGPIQHAQRLCATKHTQVTHLLAAQKAVFEFNTASPGDTPGRRFGVEVGVVLAKARTLRWQLKATTR